jgi:endoglucanase
LGAYVDLDGAWTGNADAENEVTSFESTIGRKLAINHHYYSWANVFPSGLEQWDLSGGRIPLISWGGTRLDDILNGSQDGLIAARADGVRALGQPVFLRWCWEMNASWTGCGGAANNDRGRTNGPSKFVAAWRRIHNIFVQRGATNAVWVWSPNSDDVPASSWNHWTRYYPGNSYVDWVGIDGYNWGTTQSWSRWTAFSTIVSRIYSDYARAKPIMVAETASAEQGGNKAQWIADTASKLKSSFPSIAAFLWFHVNKETNWRVDSSPSALEAFRTVGRDPYFGGTSGTTGTSGSGGRTTGAPESPRVVGLSAQPRRVVNAARIDFKLHSRAHVSILIRRTATGRTVRHLLTNHRYFAGRHHQRWHGVNDHRDRVRPGLYTIRVKAKRAGERSVRKTHLKVIR